MKRGPVSYRPVNRPKEVTERIREIEREFHVRAFGEELARVNLDFTLEERRRYIEWMRECARNNRARSESPKLGEVDPGKSE